MSNCFTAYDNGFIDFSKNASVRRIVYSGSIEQEAMPAGESTGLRYYSAPKGWRYYYSRSRGGAASLRAVIGANTNEIMSCRGDTNLDAVVLLNIKSRNGTNGLDCTCPSVIIPESFYEFRADAPVAIDKIVFRRETPATAVYINSSPKIGKVYVPQGSLEAYKSATGWSALADIMEEFTEETILW